MAMHARFGASLLCLFLLGAGCGRTGQLGVYSSSPSDAGIDFAVGDGGAGDGGCVCPTGLQCVDGECCAGLICVPPPDAGLGDLAVPTDGGTRRDLAVPPSDGGRPPDLAGPRDLGGPCTRNDQCPSGQVCDWLTGQCVPSLSCRRDRDCPRGQACIAGQCLPFQACLPFPIPGIPRCPDGEVCRFPPGVCVPASNCSRRMPCPTGEQCVAGYCQPLGCVDESDCNAGYACIGGQCQPRLYCGRFERCPRGMHCQSHVCVP